MGMTPADLRQDAEQAVADLLFALGEVPDREGLRDTPGRVVRAFMEMTAGYREDPASILTASFDEKADEIVMCRNIPFVSVCEHHMLPFTGVAHVGYLPGDKVVGLSKLARVVDCFARRFQVQERMTTQIVDAIMDHAEARAAGVVVVAEHLCMSCRGVRKPGADMVTSALRGTMKTDFAQRSEFLSLVLGSPHR